MANRYPHPVTDVPHFVVVGRRRAMGFRDRHWGPSDLVLWTCVVAWALMDIVTTAVGLNTGMAEEANKLGANVYDAGGAVALLQVKVVVLLGVLSLWAWAPGRLRPYVRAGTLAGGLLTFAAATHNALLLL